MIKDKKCIVFGGAGSIGSELVRQLSENNEVYIFDIDETRCFDLLEELRLDNKKVYGRVGDIRDINSVNNAILTFKPDIVFVASALKHVTPCENNPEEAVKTNVLGLLNIILTSKASNISNFIFVSSDKAADPHTVMGMTKRIGEIMTKTAGFVSVRFANVLGSRGSVIPIWQKQLDEKKPLTITHPDMERYFMTIPQAVSLVIEAAEVGEPGDIIVLDMGKPIKIIDLAREIIEKSGQSIELKEIGIRPGESMTEKLMTDEERKVAVKKNSFWVIK